MGLLQKAVETYDAHETLVGKIVADHQPIAPVSHIITNADFEITIDSNGRFVNVTQLGKNDNRKTVIPATEDSSGRTSAPCAHPLCEQVGYLSGQNEKKFNMYVEQLQKWADSEFSHPMLMPILNYVKGKTLLHDLNENEIKNFDDKQLIRWKVIGIGEESGACWENKNLFDSFIKWYECIRTQENTNSEMCMITGKFANPAKNHPKNIISLHGNAKLISANDNSNFTYRGRFTEDRQAVTISYTASQKAHSALHWLAEEQGVRMVFGKRIFMCWNPQGKTVPHATLPFVKETIPNISLTDYRKELKRTLDGYRTELPDNSGGIIVAAFDAATSGRLALTYYNELMPSDFLERLCYWDETCCWWDWNPETRRYNAIQSPPLWQIVNCAFGTQRKEKESLRLVTDDKIMKQQIQRLMACRVDKALFPTDIKQALVNRASMPEAYDTGVYNRLLSIACAVIKKYYYDHMKEELSMTLEQEREDRSYQFGRLLAVLDRAERDYYQKSGEPRQTTALKSMSAFCRRPYTIYERMHRHLVSAYLPRIEPWQNKRFRELNGEINEKLQAFPISELNKPLDDTYLIGFYTQQEDFYKTKKHETQEEN